MEPVNFFDLNPIDMSHYILGMTSFIVKYTSIFVGKLIFWSSYSILNAGYRMICRGFGFLGNMFNNGDGPNNLDDGFLDDREDDWDLVNALE